MPSSATFRNALVLAGAAFVAARPAALVARSSIPSAAPVSSTAPAVSAPPYSAAPAVSAPAYSSAASAAPSVAPAISSVAPAPSVPAYSSAAPVQPSAVPAYSSAAPAYSSAPQAVSAPAYSSAAPAQSSAAPAYSSVAPAYSSVATAVSSAAPAYSSVAPAASSVAPAYSSAAPAYSSVAPGASSAAPASASVASGYQSPAANAAVSYSSPGAPESTSTPFGGSLTDIPAIVTPSGLVSGPPGTATNSVGIFAGPASTTGASAASATWHIDVEVGQSSFQIGDADSTTFQGIWGSVCGANGCDGGTPQTFTYNGIGLGLETQETGTFVMSGSIDNNDAITNDLLSAIDAALQGSKQCSTQNVENCPASKRNPDTPYGDMGCRNQPLTQCTVANYIQATIYNDASDQQGQITMNGSSNSAEFDCANVLGMMNGMATTMDLPPPIVGATVFAQVICQEAEASSS